MGAETLAKRGMKVKLLITRYPLL